MDSDALEYAAGWRPNEGDTIVGNVTDLSQGWSDQAGEYYPIVTVKKDDGSEVAVHAFHHILKSRLMQLRPDIGDKIGIKFKGKVPTKDGKRTVAVYVVKVEGKQVDIWGSMTDPKTAAAPATTSSDIPSTMTTDDDIPF